MKFRSLLIINLLFVLAAAPVVAQEFWDGETITFTKAANADWTLEENQDRITDSVWITRQTTWSIFNIQKGDISSFTDCTENPGQPYDTEWAYGTIADGIENLTFDNFLGENFVACAPGESATSPVGKDAVLHLISEDIYINIKFTDWGVGGAGGGSFAYERATDPFVSVDEVPADRAITISPNPAMNEIQIAGIESIVPMDYQVYSITGALMQKGVMVPAEAISIEELPSGVYYLQVGQEGQIAKFLKY